MKSEETSANDVWQRTRHTNLIRYEPSGILFARFKVKGKLIRRSLKTKSITVAKLRLSDLEKEERQRAESQAAVANGEMTFGNALAIYRQRLEADPSLKPRTKEYRQERIAALLKSWSSLERTDVRRITKSSCLEWAGGYSKKVSSTNFNNTIGTLKQILDIAVDAGAVYENPTRFIKRVPVRFKIPELPSEAQFEELLSLAKHTTVADLIRFLAYGGFRKAEAGNITWLDIDFQKGLIRVAGDRQTGTKNGEIRFVPMIPDMRALLERLRAERPTESQTDAVMKAKECQRTIDSVCRKMGIPRFTHHGLRHLFMTKCIESGVPVPTASKWLGHKDGGALAMKRYGHLRDDHSTDMAQRVRFSQHEVASNASSQAILNQEVH